MASPSSSLSSRNWSYNVFASFHGPDVRKTFLSHLREQFNRNGITLFDDQKIVRSATIAPSLTKGIKESRISIVIFSKKYASSSWCLDELVEILKCKEVMGQIVMTIFYGVEPSDVRKQTGEFGVAFNESCERKTDEERQKWSKALNDVGNIAGEDFLRWDNEAEMIKKIARDVSDKLNATPSRDFDGMMGLETHLREMESLLDLDYEGVKMVAITGPAGIGKTTIARALHSLLSNRFQLTCFLDSLRGSYYSGLDELRLQEQFLSKVLNQDGIRICHSGVIEERLCKQRVLIVLDDVNHIKQLEALANEPTWFGPGSRIVITTENKELLQQHGISNTYHVGFPSDEQALKILSRYAFKQSYPRHGFKELAKRVTELCGKLPLGLRVVGSSLRGKMVDEWEDVMNRLETILDRDIEDVLRVSYENLDENEQTLFLHIAVFFNYKDGDLVNAMFADCTLNVKRCLKILNNRSLIEISTYWERIVMHKLLQQMARQAIRKQEPWKRQILIDAQEICDVLENETGTRVVSGISFDISRIDEVSIGKKAFKRMSNLLFLSVYKSKDDGNDRMHIPEGMEFPRRLRLLHWEAYPSKCLPPTFHTEYLVELNMKHSKLEYLWQGTQLLTNLKKLNLEGCFYLKELPDLSNATNLEKLNMMDCKSLVEIPSTCSHLHKLRKLWMTNCINLEVISGHLNLASLKYVSMEGCSRLRNFPVRSMRIDLCISKSEVEDVPASISLCSHLRYNSIINCNGKLKGITHLPTSVTHINLSYTDIERIPDCIKAFHRLQYLYLSGCRRLASLPELPRSLQFLYAEDCESLEILYEHEYVRFPSNTLPVHLHFNNCIKLGEQARREIIRHSICNGETCLPGREVPAEFHHRARGNSLTIRFEGRRPIVSSTGYKVCLVVSPKQQTEGNRGPILCSVVNDGFELIDKVVFLPKCRTEHLFIFHMQVFRGGVEIVFEFSSQFHDFDVIECGAQVEDENYRFTSGIEAIEDQVSERDNEDCELNSKAKNIFMAIAYCCSWLIRKIGFRDDRSRKQ